MEYNNLLYFNPITEDCKIWRDILLGDYVIFLSASPARIIIAKLFDKRIDDSKGSYESEVPLISEFQVLSSSDNISFSTFQLFKRFDTLSEHQFEDICKSNKIIVPKLEIIYSREPQIIIKNDTYAIEIARSYSDYLGITEFSKYHSFGIRNAMFAFICKNNKGETKGAVLFDISESSSKEHRLALQVFGDEYKTLKRNSIFIHRLYSSKDRHKVTDVHQTLIEAIFYVGNILTINNLALVEGISYEFHPVAETLGFHTETPDSINDSFYFWKPFNNTREIYRQPPNYNLNKPRIHEIVKARSQYKYWFIIGKLKDLTKGIREKRWLLRKEKINTGRWQMLNDTCIVYFYSIDTNELLGFGKVKNIIQNKDQEYPSYELNIFFTEFIKAAKALKINVQEFNRLYLPNRGGIFDVSSKIGIKLRDHIINTKNIAKMWINPNPYLLHKTEFNYKKKQIFLIQAYSLNESIYPTLKSLLERNGFELTYFTDRDGQVVFEDIWNLLNECEAVIVDFTLKRPNVYLEFGMAIVLGKPVIAISQNKDDIPTDTPNLKCIVYTDKLGDKILETKLPNAIRQTISDIQNLNDQALSILDAN
ncbi:MAG: hypothetical protein IPG12_10665 [Saprospiraceae bacterium]|nr:hypothetical protein [Saprospiraceae bacterium]